MKHHAFKAFCGLIGILLSTSCAAQQVYPLITATTGLQNNVHLKDTQNELTSFTGTYTASYDNRQITLYITKQNDKLIKFKNQQFYRDVINVRYIVKNSAGAVLQNTKDMVFSSDQHEHAITSKWVTDAGTKAVLYYGGTNCGVGWGTIFLRKISPTQLSWEYRPNSTLIDEARCPAGTDLNVYLPVKDDLILTKQ